ncbi:hypothetical protein Metal_3073 [Methylomicrobium album BG8]|uniref:Phage MuF C-terminal domain-containing protein n=2 Tax=Methylococcaceae TaxID=403 RepID=H8GN39_METAL|nr:hypothetical protein Metal_3073 [Methylomicrobium album BG8]
MAPQHMPFGIHGIDAPFPQRILLDSYRPVSQILSVDADEFRRDVAAHPDYYLMIAGHDYLKGFAKDNVVGEMAKIKIALSKAKSSADLAAVADKLKKMAPVSEDPSNPLHGDAVSSAENKGGIKFSRSTKNTHPKTFVSSPDGSLDFGEITQDISTTIGRQPAKIRLRYGDEKEGLVHIELRHQDDIKALGFDSAIDFINEITRNFTRIHKSDKPNSRSLILVEDKGKLKFAAIQLEPSEDGEFYEIKNATPGRDDQFKNKKPLWERAGPSASSDKQTLLIPEAKADETSITDTDQNTSLSSKTDRPVSGSTVADVKSWLPKRVKRLLDAGKLKVVQSVEDLPAYLQERGTALYHAAWHGTPHDFDRFSLEHIGKGEGAQAFGYGLYFADSKGIAEYYRKGLSARDFIDLARDSYDEYSTPGDAVDEMLTNPNLSDAQKELLIALQNDDWLGFDYPHQAISAALKHPDDYDLSDETKQALANQGRLYQVELAPEQDEYLLWDKPLSEQSDKIKKALKVLGMWPRNPDDVMGGDVAVRPGDGSYEKEDRADRMHRAGIRGIKYLDATSRSGESENYNYVIFSDEDISITAKYSKLAGVEALYDGRHDQMYLVADMLNQDNLPSVLAHELLHRAEAVDPQLKAAINRFENQLDRSFKHAAAGRGSAIEKAAYRRVMDAKTPAADQAEEYRAYLVSEYSKRPDSLGGMVRKAIEDFIAAIRVALIRSGLDMGFIKSLTPADLAAMSRYGAKVASSNVKQTGENGKADRMASRSQTTREAYEKRIDELFADPQNINRNSLREIKILDRGDVLDLIGFGDLPVYVHEAHAVDDGHYNHSLTAEQWKKIPEWLENPNLVLERQSDGHLTIIAPEKSADGKAIIVALEPQAESKGRTEAKNRHLVLTAYAKDRGVMPVDKYIESGHHKPLYVNQKISPKFYLGSGVQFASEPSKIRAWNKSLKTDRDLVKYRKPPDSDKSSSGIKFSRAQNENQSIDELLGDHSESSRHELKNRAKHYLDNIIHALDGMGPLKDLPNKDDYLVKRYLTLGKLAKVDEVARGIYDAFKDAGEDQANVFEYLTNKYANPSIIKNEAIRASAVKTKKTIIDVGQKLVDRGLLDEETYDQNLGGYLPRLYLKHLLDDNIISALGTGKKPSNMGYLKSRKDIPPDVRRLILGEITHPGYLASKGYGIQMRDVALLDWLEQISENKDWVLQQSLVDWKGRKVTPLYLKAEAQRIRAQALVGWIRRQAIRLALKAVGVLLSRKRPTTLLFITLDVDNSIYAWEATIPRMGRSRLEPANYLNFASISNRYSISFSVWCAEICKRISSSPFGTTG